MLRRADWQIITDVSEHRATPSIQNSQAQEQWPRRVVFVHFTCKNILSGKTLSDGGSSFLRNVGYYLLVDKV